MVRSGFPVFDPVGCGAGGDALALAGLDQALALGGRGGGGVDVRLASGVGGGAGLCVDGDRAGLCGLRPAIEFCAVFDWCFAIDLAINAEEMAPSINTVLGFLISFILFVFMVFLIDVL